MNFFKALEQNIATQARDFVQNNALLFGNIGMTEDCAISLIREAMSVGANVFQNTDIAVEMRKTKLTPRRSPATLEP